MDTEERISFLESRINYVFKDKALIFEALCHSSYVNERRDEHIKCNERLEFLGDSILSKIVSEYLFFEYPTLNEGGLSAMRREIVDSETLAHYAEKINIGASLMLGNGEDQNGGRARRSNLEDAFEAVVAAVYIDGGIEAAKNFVIPLIAETAEKNYSQHRLSDSKSKLQEIVQRGGGEAPRYVITGESGPDHNKHFECDVLVDENVMGHGSGPSKKEAEKAAAAQALAYFGEKQ